MVHRWMVLLKYTFCWEIHLWFFREWYKGEPLFSLLARHSLSLPSSGDLGWISFVSKNNWYRRPSIDLPAVAPSWRRVGGLIAVVGYALSLTTCPRLLKIQVQNTERMSELCQTCFPPPLPPLQHPPSYIIPMLINYGILVIKTRQASKGTRKTELHKSKPFSNRKNKFIFEMKQGHQENRICFLDTGGTVPEC